MKQFHRCDSAERQHYSLPQYSTFQLHGQVRYAGKLKKSIGWHENLHNHAFCELILVIDGCGTVTAANQTRFVSKGDIIIYNPLVYHLEKSGQENPLEIKFFALDKFKLPGLPKNHLLSEQQDFIYSAGEYFALLHRLMEQIIIEFERKSIYYSEIIHGLVQTFTLYILRLANQNELHHALKSPYDPVKTALAYIDRYYALPLSLDQLAKKCTVSKFYLSHLFTERNGTTVGQYLTKRRILAAKQLLTTEKFSIAEISEQIGFHDTGYFCRVFKKECGLSPLQYRKTQQSNPSQAVLLSRGE